ncbi:MAG: GlsB/YeaQ/YmgE family stress response membrane protein [Eubacteriaceae bacterium]|nr:GlsB/YeaQ/YmgE family stress response membrane protein [Eubacteriaceae bacterium]
MIIWLIWIGVGALIGFIASSIMGSDGGFLRNAALGVVGSVVGGYVAKLLGVYADYFSIGGIAISVAGACLVIYLVRKLFK